MPQQRLGLRGKYDSVGQDRIPQRFFTKTVPRQEKLPSRRVVNGEGEHALQVIEHLGPAACIEVQQHLCVAVGAEGRPLGSELFSQ